MNEGDLTLEAAKSLFLMNRESRNYSPKTVRWYSDMIGRFAEWFGAEEKIASIDANAISEYARSVRDSRYRSRLSRPKGEAPCPDTAWSRLMGPVDQAAVVAVIGDAILSLS